VCIRDNPRRRGSPLSPFISCGHRLHFALAPGAIKAPPARPEAELVVLPSPQKHLEKNPVFDSKNATFLALF